MPTERATFTALPHGVLRTDEGPRLRVTVFISPRVTLAAGETATLADCSLFDAWPSHLPEFAIANNLNNEAATAAEPTSPVADGQTWKDVFSRKLALESRKTEDLTQRAIRSFPAKDVADRITQLYGNVAVWFPSTFPPTSFVDSELGSLVDLTGHSKERYDRVEGLLPPGKWDAVTKEPRLGKSGTRFITMPDAASPQQKQTLAFAQLARFYDRPGTQQAETKRDESDTPPPPDIPRFDFHGVCAFVGDYPLLLRRLGLAVDLLVDPDELGIGEGTNGWIRVVVRDPANDLGWAAANEWRPRTRFKWRDGVFVAETKDDGLADIRDGMLNLDSKGKFFVAAFDVDGAALKLIQLARSAHEQTNKPAAHDSGKTSLAALRSTGVTLYRTGRAERTAGRADATKKQDQTSGNQTIELWADDVNRGFRIDISHDSAGDWLTLCERDGTYVMRRPHTAAKPLDVPQRDEGYVKAGSASAVTDGDPDLYQHEAVFGWEGWSLVATRPTGKILGQLEAEDPKPLQLSEDCPLDASFEVAPGTLPALRFGRSYRMRARAVDLAGNSHDLKETPDGMTTEVVPFHRWEPVPPPVVVPRWPYGEGESALRMVIRSTRGITPQNYVNLAHVQQLPRHASPPPGVSFAYRVIDERHIVPARTSQQMAELHGRFDLSMGAVNAGNYDTYFTLATREENVLADDNAAGYHVIGPDATSSIGVSELTTAPGIDGAYFVLDVDQLTVPYLPDPFAVGASLEETSVGLDHQPEFTGAWPDADGFRIRIVDGPAGTAPVWDTPADPRVLVVTVPQATTAHVRLSSSLRDVDLKQMAVWNLIAGTTPQYEQFAVLGKHWMLNPPEDLVLVHAVEKPLTDPAIHLDGDAISRTHAATYAVLGGHIANHAKSTGRIDVDAVWTEPLDDELKETGPEVIDGTAHVGDFNIAATENQARTGNDDTAPGATTPVHKLRHEFGDTKHRWVTYTAKATTRFRDYFPPEITNVEDLITAKGQTLRRSVPSSRRPDPPEVLYIVPTFEWDDERWGGPIRVTRRGAVRLSGKLAPGHRRIRRGGGLRVYLDRPWYSSGDDELLAAVVMNQSPPRIFAELAPRVAEQAGLLAAAGIDVPLLLEAATKLTRRGVTAEVLVSAMAEAVTARTAGEEATALFKQVRELGPISELLFEPGDPTRYVSDWGTDPAWDGIGVRARPRIESFSNWQDYATGLTLAEVANAPVAVAAWKPEFDADRRLWYCDIDMDPGAAYFPFVRLLLARYQPYSLAGIHLSKTVRAEFAQLVPERRTTVRPASGYSGVTVTVEGPAASNYYGTHVLPDPVRGSNPVDLSRLVRCRLEQRPVNSTTDLDWVEASPWQNLAPVSSASAGSARWRGAVRVPEVGTNVEYRAAVEEREIYDTDQPVAEFEHVSKFTKLYVRSRLVYADHFGLVATSDGTLQTLPPE